ncbi:HAD family hydrolase [Rheinheimera pacifica]|uniref:HAD family hydrolase n=1 Tax=Rheinheimera pacifica TaxID=173990 RepID=UPI002EDA9975
MILIFDLDDTLYDERQFVESGFRAVADMAQQRWQLDAAAGFRRLCQLLDSQGRGRIFDDWLGPHNLATKTNISDCVRRYRLHKPKLTLPPTHRQMLQSLPGPLYLVTDGHKIVQQNKVEALGLAAYFKRIFITHRFGIKHAKPSTYCFELIQKAEQCRWQDLVYIGDNPAKDFVNLNKKGAGTIRILTGCHKDVPAKPGYDAKTRLHTLTELMPLLKGNHDNV